MKKPEYKDHVGQSVTVKDETGVDWQGQTIEAKAALIEKDSMNYGETTVVRTFFFQLPSRPSGVPLPTKESLLVNHRSRVVAFLWKDELELIEEPRIYWRKELPQGSLRSTMSIQKIPFVIIAVCHAKKGSLIYKDPLNLNGDISPKHRKKI